MIDKTLDLINTVLLNYLKSLKELNITSEDVVKLTPIIKFDGDIAIPQNTLGITLVSMEEERVVKSQNNTVKTSEGKIAYQNPELKLNLFILIAAYFKDYKTGLKFLSGAIRCFQSKYVFTPQNTPAMDSKIQKLIVEMHSTGFESQNYLWGSLGAKYLPSVLYKVRMLTIQEALQNFEAEPITSINISQTRINN